MRAIREHLRRIWVVFGTASMQSMLRALIGEALDDCEPERALPVGRLRLIHVRRVPATLREDAASRDDALNDATCAAIAAAPLPSNDFDYETRARNLLAAGPLEPRCDALFIDEARDMGADVLRLLLALVRPWPGLKTDRRAAHVFIDNNL